MAPAAEASACARQDEVEDVAVMVRGGYKSHQLERLVHAEDKRRLRSVISGLSSNHE